MDFFVGYKMADNKQMPVETIAALYKQFNELHKDALRLGGPFGKPEEKHCDDYFLALKAMDAIIDDVRLIDMRAAAVRVKARLTRQQPG